MKSWGLRFWHVTCKWTCCPQLKTCWDKPSRKQTVAPWTCWDKPLQRWIRAFQPSRAFQASDAGFFRKKSWKLQMQGFCRKTSWKLQMQGFFRKNSWKLQMQGFFEKTVESFRCKVFSKKKVESFRCKVFVEKTVESFRNRMWKIQQDVRVLACISGAYDFSHLKHVSCKMQGNLTSPSFQPREHISTFPTLAKFLGLGSCFQPMAFSLGTYPFSQHIGWNGGCRP